MTTSCAQIYNVDPLTTGQSVQGPANITISAWGVGMWDTKPEAQINGQKCAFTTWVDNQTVICTTAANSRVNLQNPELKVAGQRSSCGILVPGVCAVSASHGSVNSPQRMRAQIQAIKARGGDWKTAEKILKQQQRVIGDGFTAKNDKEDPCRSWITCKPRTYIDAITSAVLMMMGMASFCFTIYVMRPLSSWVYKEYIEIRDEEEDDDDEPREMTMGLDNRLRSMPRAESYAMQVHLG
mmetsp:Transcript_48077/g.75080  ORF Transcript_48077/g.75080 Transcript_48077/m.75080 type:complete len:239 (+) Transcript_48077:698-1414(+)